MSELSRRELIGRATTLGLGALVLGALPIVERMAKPGAAFAQGLPADPDGTLQAFFDTIIPGRKVAGLKTELGHPIHPDAIAGVDREHGAVYTDALLLAHNPTAMTAEPSVVKNVKYFAAPRNDGFILMPSFSFTTTASPRATNFPLTNTSIGSPASLSSSITDP